MDVVAIVLLAGGLAGVLVWLLVAHWPGLDPAKPRVATKAVTREVVRHPALDSFLHRRTDPATATGLALTAAVVLAAGGAIGIGTLLLMVQTDSGFARWDQSFGQW